MNGIILEVTYLFQVRHRWCELVVKHQYTKHNTDVEKFLLEDQVQNFLNLRNICNYREAELQS